MRRVRRQLERVKNNLYLLWLNKFLSITWMNLQTKTPFAREWRLLCQRSSWPSLHTRTNYWCRSRADGKSQRLLWNAPLPFIGRSTCNRKTGMLQQVFGIYSVYSIESQHNWPLLRQVSAVSGGLWFLPFPHSRRFGQTGDVQLPCQTTRRCHLLSVRYSMDLLRRFKLNFCTVKNKLTINVVFCR